MSKNIQQARKKNHLQKANIAIKHALSLLCFFHNQELNVY